jgi:integrase
MRRAKLLPGLAVATKRLADGSRRKYFYAWRGGPQLPGQPGNPDFLIAYAAAHEARKKPAPGAMLSLIAAFKASSEFTKKAPRTKKDYLRFLKMIEDEFGDMPLSLLEKPKARGLFKTWRDGMAHHPRTADYAWGMLARVLSVAKDRGTITTNVCERGGRLYSVDRAEITWQAEHIGAFGAVASPELRFALIVALWTAQRQGDLIRLTWSQYDGVHIRLKQSKTAARVVIPVGSVLKGALDAQRRTDGPILRNSRGKAWTGDGFRTSWGKATDKAGIEGLRFHDLRGTAVTRLSLAGCNNQQIAAITGHSEKEVDRIISAYRGGRIELAEQAMVLLELQTDVQTAPTVPLFEPPNPL